MDTLFDIQVAVKGAKNVLDERSMSEWIRLQWWPTFKWTKGEWPGSHEYWWQQVWETPRDILKKYIKIHREKKNTDKDKQNATRTKKKKMRKKKKKNFLADSGTLLFTVCFLYYYNLIMSTVVYFIDILCIYTYVPIEFKIYCQN